jgi:hypothetical protein
VIGLTAEVEPLDIKALHEPDEGEAALLGQQKFWLTPLTVNVTKSVPVPPPVPITYTLKPDCTGTYSVQNGPNFDILVGVDGSALSVIDTDTGVSLLEGPNQRVGFGR